MATLLRRALLRSSFLSPNSWNQEGVRIPHIDIGSTGDLPARPVAEVVTPGRLGAIYAESMGNPVAAQSI